MATYSRLGNVCLGIYLLLQGLVLLLGLSFVGLPILLGMGTAIALAIGLIGGLLPAIRAARLPVATALREL